MYDDHRPPEEGKTDKMGVASDMSGKAKRNPWLTCCVVTTIIILIIVIVALIFALCVAWYVGFMEQWGGNVKVSEGNQEQICWGAEFTKEKIDKANADCGLKDDEWKHVMWPNWEDDLVRQCKKTVQKNPFALFPDK